MNRYKIVCVFFCNTAFITYSYCFNHVNYTPFILSGQGFAPYIAELAYFSHPSSALKFSVYLFRHPTYAIHRVYHCFSIPVRLSMMLSLVIHRGIIFCIHVPTQRLLAYTSPHYPTTSSVMYTLVYIQDCILN